MSTRARVRTRRRVVMTSIAGVVVLAAVAVLTTSRLPAEEAGAFPSGCPSTPTVVGDGLVVSCKWASFLSGQVFQSSPNLATLDDNGPSIVVGSRDTGQVFALHLSDGSVVPGWPASTGSAVDSSPTVVPGSGALDDVVVDAGDVTAGPPASLGIGTGAMDEFGPDGSLRWSSALPDQFGDFGSQPALYATPPAADVTGSGQPSLVTGGVSLSQYAVDASSGATEPGWPRKTADSTFSSAAVADLDGGARPIVVAGSDSTAGPGALYDWNGGVVRAEDGFGRVLWVHRTGEVVTSSPAVGNLDGTGNKVVFGQGRYWADREPTSDATDVTALNADGSVAWQQSLSGYTPASPALADVTGNPGELDVIEPTWMANGSSDGGGQVYALDPHGNVLWGPVSQTYVAGEAGNPADIYGGAAAASFTPGYDDAVFGSTFGWNIIDGRSGALLLPQPTTTAVNLDGEYVNWDGTVANLNIQSTPLITPDPVSGMDVVLAGTYAPADSSGDRGFVAVYQVQNAPADGAGAGSWPMFHHDPQHTGAASPPALHCPGCTPVVTDRGYWLVAADGGVFAFGDAGFFGSLGGAYLSKPVVGMAATVDGLGYWLVAADGGVFAFGQATFHGSMGGRRLARPVVGIAPIAGSGGYRLVAADGGVFALGASYAGSMGGTFLAAPVVGLTSPPPDVAGGYWEVAADGGVFAFGGAPFYGSAGAIPLAAPMVAMAPA